MNRLALQNRLLIKRFVMERLLYSEIGGFNALKSRDNMGPTELEYKINTSIGLTLNFFNDTLPNIFASVYAFTREGIDLLGNWNNIDPLLIIHPIVMGFVHKFGQLIRTKLIDKKKGTIQMHAHSTTMSKMVCNALEGLADIQVNNLQQAQLSLLDQMIVDELSLSEGYTSFFSRTWSSISSRSVLDFAVEVYVAHSVMARRSLSNKDYRTMQLDIDRVMRLARRTYHSIRLARHMWKDQSKVMKLLNIPNFIDEDKTLFRVSGNFKELKISYVKFSYKTNPSLSMAMPMLEPDIPALDLQGEMLIHPNKSYALIGQNRAGKSTINHLLCKLYSPDEGEITLDGVPYSDISRTSLRSIITYVSQRPFIFPGSVRDNILVGNPDATDEDVEAAAEAAGVFAFAEASGMFNYFVPPKKSESIPDLHAKSRDSKETSEESGYETESDDGMYDSTSEDETEPSRVGGGRVGGEVEIEEKELAVTTGAVNEGEGQLNIPFKPFINSIGHTTLSQDEQADDELNNVDLDIPILPEHLQSSYHGYSGTANLGGLERVEEHDMLGHGLGVWNRVKALETERDLEETREHHHKRHHRKRKARRHRPSSHSSHPDPTRPILPEPSTNPDSTGTNSTNEGADDRAPGTGNGTAEGGGGFFSSLFECKLPYAFPRAYPEDESDDEEPQVRPPPVVPHRSGPSCSHPILDQEIEARGQNVSGGFAQSIALARIFVRHETKILILDEAMSQMDAYKKREIIYPRLFEFTRKFGIALIIITHDLLSIQDVDHVFVLDQGRLVHQGTHNELLAQRAEVYMRLLGM
eukprot:Phypoly_transcript_02292.p1 GENE.Phypoly_transcript_02292~~Phypoly_transcript_02292.p1  ORF type:complete len:940 (+),score=120.89 Phypoly_transcript_02292:395-2821(+)